MNVFPAENIGTIVGVYLAGSMFAETYLQTAILSLSITHTPLFSHFTEVHRLDGVVGSTVVGTG